MVDVFHYHEISESTHRLMNPISMDKLLEIGDRCELQHGDRHLDLACGKGEMLCQYALRYGTVGRGIDIYAPLIEIARQRAAELGVHETVSLEEGDASHSLDGEASYELVSCVGATWIGGGLIGTLEIMTRYAKPDAWLLVGEVYWAVPPSAALAAHLGGPDEFADLGGTLDRFEAAGVELVDMALSNADEWDRYSASQWRNVARWLDAHPDDPIAADLGAERDTSRRQYLTAERGVLGWGVFVGQRTSSSRAGGVA